jgi:hypothetical protein
LIADYNSAVPVGPRRSAFMKTDGGVAYGGQQETLGRCAVGRLLLGAENTPSLLPPRI